MKRPAEIDVFVVDDMFVVHSVCAVSRVVGVTGVQQHERAVDCRPALRVSYRHGFFFSVILIERKKFLRRSARRVTASVCIPTYQVGYAPGMPHLSGAG